MKIERIMSPKMIVHSVWTRIIEGDEFCIYRDYIVDEPDWLNDDDIEDWKREIREFIEDEARSVCILSKAKLKTVKIWYDFTTKEIEF